MKKICNLFYILSAVFFINATCLAAQQGKNEQLIKFTSIEQAKQFCPATNQIKFIPGHAPRAQADIKKSIFLNKTTFLDAKFIGKKGQHTFTSANSCEMVKGIRPEPIDYKKLDNNQRQKHLCVLIVAPKSLNQQQQIQEMQFSRYEGVYGYKKGKQIACFYRYPGKQKLAGVLWLATGFASTPVSNQKEQFEAFLKRAKKIYDVIKSN
ncbi:MAG: hypothetical protein AAGG80_00540 [Pseudomonadota bacterium]